MTPSEQNTDKRILVVEDDDSVRAMISTALSDEGFEVLTAQDGYHALRIVAAGRPDLIVLDFGLPLLDGPSFALQWRERVPPEQHVPIIGISGLPNGADLARHSKVDEFLAKPLDLDVLVGTVTRLA